MNQNILAVSVIALSVVIGFTVSLDTDKAGFRSLGTPGDAGDTGSAEESSLEYGSAHEHALFYVVINGSERMFTADRFQLNSRYVHLENNRSDIVHKHSEGVTWGQFMDTVNVSVNADASSLCYHEYGERYCGPGKFVLNNESNPVLDTEIQQGDNMVIVIGENASATAEDYMERELPPAYKSQGSQGRSA